jgi:hypothetical protein
MTAFTYECDLDHPVSAEVEQTILYTLEPILSSQGMERVQVTPDLGHDGDPVLFVEIKFRLVQPSVDPKVLIQTGPALWRALVAFGERRFPHVRYDSEDWQNTLGTETW